MITEVSAPYAARWEGTCRRCLYDLQIGDQIVRVVETFEHHAESYYIHQECA